MSRSLFIVDMASCTGCGTCNVACKDRARLPDELALLRIEAHEEGAYPAPAVYYRVVHCFHCDQPVCAEVCPVEAISKEMNGLTKIDVEKCNGCGECIDACPFDAIIMLPEGVAAKCDGCGDEIARGWEPTCVRACPMRALQYSMDEVSLEKRSRDQHFKDHYIGPAVLYLVRKQNHE
jgi:anaerobic dimethyl sulfoxide reductase subunit B (iron-sulfur subunit)